MHSKRENVTRISSLHFKEYSLGGAILIEADYLNAPLYRHTVEVAAARIRNHPIALGNRPLYGPIAMGADSVLELANKIAPRIPNHLNLRAGSRSSFSSSFWAMGGSNGTWQLRKLLQRPLYVKQPNVS
jgi:hypothetical protein